MISTNRREILKFLLAAGALSAAPNLFFSCRRKEKKPNFIIFLSDDLGYGDLGCYGNPIIKTPHIDRFAGEGIRFTDCHSGGTVCSPSRASLLTGRHPYRVGIYYLIGGGAHLRQQEITVASLLKNQGYDTCFVGKWHLSHLEDKDQPNPGDHGFNHWMATTRNAFDGPHNPGKFIRNGKKVGEVKGWYCDVVVREAIDWLKNKRDPQKPFFLLVCSHEPHTPIDPPKKYSQLYDDPLVDKLEKAISYGGIKRPERDISHLKKYYYGTVTQLDNAFGALMKAVDEMKLRDNSLVFFTSDNGPEYPVTLEISGGEWEDPLRDRCFGTPGPWRGMKRYTYEGGHRIPGIARWPGHIKAGTVSDELINGTDFLPTLCDLGGASIPQDRVIDGTSLVPVFKEKSIKRDIPPCWIFPAGYTYIPHIAMREKEFVLIGWLNEKKEEQLWMNWIKSARIEAFELYNLKKDKKENQNVSQENPELFQSMIDKMKKLWRDIQAEGPVWENWKRK